MNVGRNARYGKVSVSARLAATPAYSYRGDPAVPHFDDAHALIIYDGVCVLCSRSMQRIAAADHAGMFRFASAQSPLGQAVFKHYQLDPVAFETVLLLSEGRAFGKLDMAFEVARRLGRAWLLFALFKPLPRRWQDAAYDLVAKNRYRIFGRTEACMVPDASWRGRVIDEQDNHALTCDTANANSAGIPTENRYDQRS